MTKPHNRDSAGTDRRTFLRRAAGVAALAATGLAARGAFAEDDTLDALIGDTQRGEFGQGFDDASRTIHMPKASEPTVSTATAQTTEKAIDRYADIVARGGWPEGPSARVLRLGDRHPSVPALRARLVASGDIDPNAAGNDIYDSYVEAAVRRFQARHGLTVDGIIRAETLAAVNVPAPVRLAQLKVNVTRLRALSAHLSPRYVVANIPAARVEAIENDLAVSRHAAVAGKPDRPSPELTSKIVQINFNPYWTVPPSIVQKDLIPKMQDQPDYLTSNHIRIFDARHKELEPSQINWYSEDATHYSFKQDPGSYNS
ncbi:MAG: peptidoglycan-binding protein, partial [Xanthobacteraceae bacterium]